MTRFIVVVWNQDYCISEVCLYVCHGLSLHSQLVAFLSYTVQRGVALAVHQTI